MRPLKVRMTILLAAMMCVLCAGQASALECVSASSISLASPQAAGLAHSAELPFPTKSNDFAGTLFDAPEDYLFGRQRQGTGVGDLQTPSHLAGVVHGASHLLCNLGVGDREAVLRVSDTGSRRE